MRAIIFARVSTEEQKREGFSLPAQLVKMREYCERKGIQIKSEYEIDESSTKDERKKFEQVIDEIRQSKEKIALINETIDRLQRGFKESVLLDELRKHDLVEIHFIRENLVLSVNSNSSELLRWDMGVMFARGYVLQLSDNVKRTIIEKLRRGELPGMAPYGYSNITCSDGKKDIVLDEYESNIVKKMYEWYSTGAYSLLLIRQKLKDEYRINFSKGYVDQILKNPFYYGEMMHKGKLYPHKYAPIVSRELYIRVQSVKAGYDKKHYKFAGLPYAYRGLIRCADCGCLVTPEKHKGHIYYHCTQYKGKHNAKWIREEDLTEQFASLLKRIQIPDEVLQEIVEALKNVHKGKSEFRELQVTQLNQEKEKYAKRLENLYMDKLDGTIASEMYNELYKSFRDKIATVEAKLIQLQGAEDNYYITSSHILQLAQRAYDLFVSSEIEQKRLILKLLLQNPVMDGKTVRYNLLKPFDTILDCADNNLWLRR